MVNYIGTDTTAVANILATTYSRERYIAPHERHMTPFLDTVEEFDNGGEPVGRSRKFEIVTKDSHSSGAQAEAAAWPTFITPASLNGEITAKPVNAAVAWSDLMLAVGQGDGLIHQLDIIDRYVQMTVRNLMSNLNRLSLGTPTAYITTVQDTTDTLTTFVAANPEGVLGLREGMIIAFDNASGTFQGNTQQIVSINFETRTVTIDAARTLTAGWRVFKATVDTGTTASTSNTEYNKGLLGLRATVSNGDYGTTYAGITRSSDPQVNATVVAPTTGTQSYSESLVRKLYNRIRFANGQEPTEAWTNLGVLSEHLNYMTPNRMSVVGTGDKVPGYGIGHDEAKLGFHFGGKFIQFKVDQDLPARELYLITKENFRKHILRKSNWYGDNVGPDGSSSPQLLQMPATSNYAAAKIACLGWMGELANVQPKANAVGRKIYDAEVAGDSN
jgi:hypothetical protein